MNTDQSIIWADVTGADILFIAVNVSDKTSIEYMLLYHGRKAYYYHE